VIKRLLAKCEICGESLPADDNNALVEHLVEHGAKTKDHAAQLVNDYLWETYYSTQNESSEQVQK
jgi:hypothetical protein